MYSDEELKEITTELIETFGGFENIASPEHEPIRFASQCKMAERIVKRKKQEVTVVVLNTEDVMVSANNDSNS